MRMPLVGVQFRITPGLGTGNSSAFFNGAMVLFRRGGLMTGRGHIQARASPASGNGLPKAGST